MHHRARPLRNPDDGVIGRVAAQMPPRLGDRDRPGGGEVVPEVAVAFQRRGDSRVIRRAQDDRDLPRAEPALARQVCRAQRRQQGAHLLTQHVRRALDATASGANLAGGGAHVQAQAERGRVTFPGRPGPVDQLLIGRRRPRAVSGAVRGPPLGQALPGVRQGALEHLQGGDAPGAAHGRQHPAPRGHAAFLLAGVEQHERGMGDHGDDGEGSGGRVVHHPSPGLGVGVLPQPGHVAGQRERSRRARGDDSAPVGQLPTGLAPQPPAGHRQPLHERAARNRNPGDRSSEHPDGRGDEEQDTATAVERGHETRPADTEGNQLAQRQAEQDAASGETGELHGHQLAAALVGRFSAGHGGSLLGRLRWRGTAGGLRQWLRGRRRVRGDRGRPRLLGTARGVVGLIGERLPCFRPGGCCCFDHGGTGHDPGSDRACRRRTATCGSGRTTACASTAS
ncbi:hypothetical protein SDC9_77533 [bioreactor metagenome]|uniref:Uncharacterized protein n=1 Tax=bioreactor metagenome TaxID=1076179 RepID=A0A644YR52_9ZZZZ